MAVYTFPQGSIEVFTDALGVQRPVAASLCEFLGVPRKHNASLHCAEPLKLLGFHEVSFKGRDKKLPTRVRGVTRSEVLSLLAQSKQPEAKEFIQALHISNALSMFNQAGEACVVVFDGFPDIFSNDTLI